MADNDKKEESGIPADPTKPVPVTETNVTEPAEPKIEDPANSEERLKRIKVGRVFGGRTDTGGRAGRRP